MPHKYDKIEHQKLIKECKVDILENPVEPFSFVIFGGGGDLTKRKLMPTLYHLCIDNKLKKKFSILAFGHKPISETEYKTFIKENLKKFSPDTFDEQKWNDFQKHIHYIYGEFEDPIVYDALFKTLAKITPITESSQKQVLFYLAISPIYTPVILQNFKNHKKELKKYNTKIIVEKPVGSDEKTAKEYNNLIAEVFNESQVYRIDHYLGKETVQNIIFLRFGNTIFDPIWNKNYIDHIQITVAEPIGVETRGNFYDKVGIIRDMMQNHIMQLIALVAMEPLINFQADFIRDEKVKVYRSIRPFISTEDIENNTVIGQYEGIMGIKSYREEERVNPKSNTPTFFAGKFFIDTWRWAGVPFYVRVGKRMPEKSTKISIHFKKPPVQFFGNDCENQRTNILTLGVQPHEEITFRLSVKYPGPLNKAFPAHMHFDYEESFGKKQYPPYARLVLDTIKGDQTLFARQDAIELMWHIVDPIIKHYESQKKSSLQFYKAGTWGPQKSQDLIQKDEREWLDQ